MSFLHLFYISQLWDLADLSDPVAAEGCSLRTIFQCFVLKSTKAKAQKGTWKKLLEISAFLCLVLSRLPPQLSSCLWNPCFRSTFDVWASVVLHVFISTAISQMAPCACIAHLRCWESKCTKFSQKTVRQHKWNTVCPERELDNGRHSYVLTRPRAKIVCKTIAVSSCLLLLICVAKIPRLLPPDKSRLVRSNDTEIMPWLDCRLGLRLDLPC